MSKARLLVFLCLYGSLTVLVGCGPKTTTPVTENPTELRPNVLLIVADALRADRLEATRNGKAVMPKLRQFAADSWKFERARVQATWTKPSMATLFTSLYPEIHKALFGIHDTVFEGQPPEADVLPRDLETMAEYLKSNGYATAGIQANANITSVFGFDQGFDSYVFIRYPEFQGNDMTDRAIETLGTVKPPFFLYAHYMDTHAPYEPPEPYRDMFGTAPSVTPEDEALLKDYPSTYIDRILHETGLTTERRFGNLSPQGEAHIRQRYDEEALFMDAEIERLLEHVRTAYPNTIVIFTSDHGEELWEHGSVGHGKTVYEELTHVPLIISVPEDPPRAIGTPVEIMDILPTCARLLGLTPRPDWQGKDVSHYTTGASEGKPVFCSTQMSIPGSNVDLMSVVIDADKLIVNNKTDNSVYFNLDRDPKETDPQPVSAREQALNDALERHWQDMKNHPRYGTQAETTTIDADTRDAMENIGYIR